ncbi:MAG: MAPEG family protein [Burkholderiaceae bacterium]|nr:MAPEG family protein [Burkholderiaceae bacterium]
MTIAYFCIIVACLLPILCAGLAKSKGFGRPRREGGFDNEQPREWLAKLTGWQARANAAQANSFEALPLFVAGVLVAQQLQADQGTINGLALAFIAARLAFIGAYLADKASLRSVVWLAGVVISVALFFIGA